MRKALLTLALASLLAVPALAQFRFGGMGFGGGADATALLGNQSVQDELKLSDAQKKDIKTATDARNEAFRKAREDMDFEGIRPAQEAFTKAMKKVQEKLTTTQSQRLMQIEVQVATKNNNPRIFQSEAVQKALKFTDKQKKLVKSTFADFEKDMKELFEENKGNFRKIGEKMSEMNKEAMSTITKTFDADQQKGWKSLGGEKFEGKGFPFEMKGFGKGGFGKGGKGKKKKDDF
jgi:hypothetical protein